ncbi:hypothetical protein G6F70_003517 [Rhizopus microsporus]|uniref:Phospholipid/glycerol acyltransferase domain-containing protein n=2 Tax=Rhizopus TaxID=4842 RepID=A0A367JQ90_RHIAZ|nr:hypothetical protein G6F71_003512 [Rhizopus microsporus]RCH92113.1 hypothetical protein CU097_009146 [Rhizopus azygosporus]KAG1201021.1 hypothetical protein G6F70_003517 [Rhizopus microsporus]KAG1212883.1 hypothetical protein G6F69_003323 [Rhizopus microsporus]KAG1234863.1 hypothetical protein G6F67_003217 [Rhizopus microsporus]
MSSLERQGEGKTYITLQYLSRLALWVYFRNIKVICKAPVAAEGPLLVAANHSNMVLDPIVLIATFPHSRPCHFWALARFFRIPIVGKILEAAGVLPVDTKTHSNAKLFEHTLQSLDKGAVVALFPEGTSYTAPNHLPFKDGISWACFEYLQQLASKQEKERDSISIIPVGITYSTKNKWRSEVVVEYGEPIVQTIDDIEQFNQDPKTTVKTLTDRIAKGVEQSTINSPDWDTTHAAKQAKLILFGDARGVRLEDYVQVTQSFINLLHPDRLKQNGCLYKEERIELKERLLLFNKKMEQIGINAMDIRMYSKREITISIASVRLLTKWITLFIQIPLFLPGMIINSPFYLLGKIVDQYEPYTESVSQDKLIFSAIFAFPVYAVLVYIFDRISGYGKMTCLLYILLLLPLFAWYHMALIDKNYDMLKQAIASWRIFISVVYPKDESLLEDCSRLQHWCRDHMKQLLLKLSEHENEASYLLEYGKPLFEQ